MRVSAHVVVAALVAGALTAGGCGSDAPSGPSLEISGPPGGSVEGNVVELRVDPKGIEVVKPDNDTSGRTAHYHVFVDRAPVAVGQFTTEAGVIHSAANRILVTGMNAGKHEFNVVYGDGAHRRIHNASDSISINVKGPSVDVRAPAAMKSSGETLTVTIQAQGVQGDLRAFLDVDPTLIPVGERIPSADQRSVFAVSGTTFTTPPLPAGQHTLWIVNLNGAQRVRRPWVMDKVSVTVI